MTRSQEATQHYTPHATLAALGIKIHSLKLFDIIRGHVHIQQKTIRHTPVKKLHDAFIASLAGAHGLCEINTRLRSDESLQCAFGRSSCAEQSVVQQTLNACTTRNVAEMQEAVDLIFRQHSRAYRHNKTRLGPHPSRGAHSLAGTTAATAPDVHPLHCLREATRRTS